MSKFIRNKFRGYNPNTNKTLEGNLLQTYGSDFIIPEESRNLVIDSLVHGRKLDLEQFMVDPKTIRQTTGKVGYNGFELFEGDLVYHIGDIGEKEFFTIKYDSDEGKLVLYNKDTTLDFSEVFWEDLQIQNDEKLEK